MNGFYDRGISPKMRESKTASMPLELKELGQEGIFTGYASVFDVLDSQRDIILRGAFASSIQHKGAEIKLLWQHDMREPVGVIEELREDARGLYIKGRLMLEIARAREAYALMKEGVVRGLSIGYSPRRFKTNTETGVRMIAEVDLWEISLVTFPANESAHITVVKGAAPQNSMLHALNKAMDRAIAILMF